MSSNPATPDGDNPRTPRRKKSNDIDVLKRDPRVIDIYQHYLDLQPAGAGRWKGLCPWHNDHSPSFSVFPDSKEPDVLLFNCFTCFEEDGNVVQFVAKMEDIALPEGYPEACTEVRRMLDDEDLLAEVEKRTYRQQAPPEKEKKTYGLNDPEILKMLAGLELEEVPARGWLLKERGIGFEIAQQLSLGYRQDVTPIVSEKTLAEIEDIAAAGWIAFPYVHDGKVVAIKYRSIVRKAFVQQPGMKLTLYNLPTIDAQEDVFLTEGELDALVMEQAGFRAVALPMAKFNVTEELKDKLLAARTVYLAGDNDGKVGSAAMNKLYAEMRSSKRTFKLVWPAGMKDANQTFIEHCGRDLEKFKTLVQQLMKQARVPEWRKLFITGADADNLPPKKFLINGFLPEGTTFIGALPFHGKTFLALSMCKALVTGKPFLGQHRFSVPEPIHVLYLIPETGSAAFNERRKLLRIPDDERFLFRTLTQGQTVKLDDPLLLEAAAGRVVVLDTAIRFSDGGDENNASDTQQNIASNVYNLIAAGARGVIALHHSVKEVSGRGKRKAPFNLQTALRGSGDFAAMADAVYGIEPYEDNDDNPDFLMTLRCLKPRDFDPPPKMELQGRPYLDDIHDFGVILQESREDKEIAAFVAAVEADPTINLDDLAEQIGIARNRISEVVAPAAGYKKLNTRNGQWKKSATSQSKDTIQ